MRKFKYLGLVIFSLCIILFSFSTYSKGNDKNKNQSQNTVYKPTQDPSTSIVNINNISSIIVENGQQPPVLGGQSFNGEIPIGSQLGAVYQECILWGGLVSDGRSPIVRVGGGTYDIGNVATTRLVRVRPDYQTGDLTQDAAGFFQIPAADVTPDQIDEVRAQYAKDWQEWPANLSAPYDDVDGNGAYDPNVDIPGIPGASQTLFIGYDDREAASFYASPPIGMQVYQTYWAYATSNPLGNVIFQKIKMIYKGTADSNPDSHIDSMYIAKFCDADVGNYTDDYAGCVPELDLGYAYSSANFDSKYSTQGLVPPAVGYDFLQGASYFTGDPSDSAIIDLKWKHGYKYFQEKPMSSFTYFAAGGAWSDPTLVSNSGNYDNGTLQMYNLLRGYLPSPNYPSTPPFPRPDEFGGPVGGFGTYLLDGDPTTGQGWVDGIVEPAGDRRILCINGPVSISLGDTIEVVLALIGAQGKSNISSVSILKYYDTFAQFAYDVLFDVPIMPQPAVTSIALDREVVLNWGADKTAIDAVENQPHGAYEFEAYSVYQLPTSTTDLSQGVVVATFDVVNSITVLREIQLDEDAGETYVRPIRLLNNVDGIKRYIDIKRDFLNNTALVNGQSYRFAVTAIGYNESLEPSKILESTPLIIDIVPHTANPGVVYGGAVGDTLEVSHTGASDGSAVPLVIDPSKTTGHEYKVAFQQGEAGTTWSLTDATTGTLLIADQTNQTGDDNYFITDGVMVKVLGPPFGIKALQEEDQSGTIVDPRVGILTPSLGSTGYILNNRAGEANGPFGSGDRDFDRFDYWGNDDVTINFGEQSLTWDYITEEVHFDNGNPYMAPFSIYRHKYSDGSTVRLFAGFWDTDSNGVWSVDWEDPTFGVPAYEPIYAWQGYDANGNEISYDPANDAQYAADNSLNTSANTTFGASTGEFVYPFVTATLISLYLDGSDYPAGNVIRLVTNKGNTPADVFSFTAPDAPTSSTESAQADVEKVNVFPNPYYGYNSRETSRQGHYVTFSHLPANATIRIFDLSGVLVRTIEKNSVATQFQQWDLRNDNNYPVASGIYVAYIDMPDQAKTKVLKLAIIQEVQVLPVY